MGKGRRIRFLRVQGGHRGREKKFKEQLDVNQRGEKSQAPKSLDPGRFQELKRWLAKHLRRVFCCFPRKRSRAGNGFWAEETFDANIFAEMQEPIPLYSVARSPAPSCGGGELCVSSAEPSDVDSVELMSPVTFRFNRSPNSPRPLLVPEVKRQAKEKDPGHPSHIVRTTSFENLPGSVIEDGDLRIIERNGEFVLQRILGTPPPQDAPLFIRPMTYELSRRPISYWCPLDVTLETCRKIQWEIPKVKNAMLFNTSRETAGERWRKFNPHRVVKKLEERTSKVEEELIAELELSHTTFNLDISVGAGDIPWDTPRQVDVESGLDIGNVNGMPAAEDFGNKDLLLEKAADSDRSDERTEKMIAEVFEIVDNPDSHNNPGDQTQKETRRSPLVKLAKPDGDGKTDEMTEKMIAEIFDTVDNPDTQNNFGNQTKKEARRSPLVKLTKSDRDDKIDEETEKMIAEIFDIVDNRDTHNNFGNRTKKEARRSPLVKLAKSDGDDKIDEMTDKMIAEIFDIVDNPNLHTLGNWNQKAVPLSKSVEQAKLADEGQRDEKNEKMIDEIFDIVDNPVSHDVANWSRKKSRFSPVSEQTKSSKDGARNERPEKMIKEICDIVDNTTPLDTVGNKAKKASRRSPLVEVTVQEEAPPLLSLVSQLSLVQDHSAAKEMLGTGSSETGQQQMEAASSNVVLQDQANDDGGKVSSNALSLSDSMEQFIEEFLNDPIYDTTSI